MKARLECGLLVDSTAVRAHERIHSDARPYLCRLCHKAFKTSECLWHHENRSKSCGALAKQQQAPVVDDTVLRRKRARRADAQHIAGRPEHAPPNSVTNSSNVASACAVSAVDTSRLMFSSVAAPFLAFTASPLSAAAASSVVDSLRTPLTSNHCAPPRLSPTYDVVNSGTVVEQTEGRSSHREGLVLLANCAASHPDDVRMPLTQVKVEPEIVLSDYELTAINSPEVSFYERKRIAAAEITSTTSSTDALVTTPVTRSSDREIGGPLTLANGRIECQQCGRQYANIVAYKKHTIIHRLETISCFTK